MPCPRGWRWAREGFPAHGVGEKAGKGFPAHGVGEKAGKGFPAHGIWVYSLNCLTRRLYLSPSYRQFILRFDGAHI